MLTRELGIAEYSSGRIVPDRLTQKRHAHYQAYADQLLDLYRHGTGRTRCDLHRSVHQIFSGELECPIRRIDAFSKLLDEKSTYDHDRRGNAYKLRQQVFRLAAGRHPLVQMADDLFESSESKVKSEIAASLGKSWIEIERELFADVMQFHRLASFEGYENGAALLSRYNIAQCQTVLYDAISMTVWAGGDFKPILRYAKLARLMHTIERQSNGQYVFRFDGPSSVLRPSRRYGVAMAKFLPALLACRDWRMQATIRHRRANWKNLFRLSSADGLQSHLPGQNEFDSTLEENFANRWGNEPREGWSMIREGEVLHSNQKGFVPDFVFQHQSDRRVLMEVVGFWTPEYLAAKFQTLRLFRGHSILLAISDTLNWPGDEPREITNRDLNVDSIRFKTNLRIDDVLDRLRVRLTDPMRYGSDQVSRRS